MIKITNTATSIHTITNSIETIECFLYHDLGLQKIPGYIELVTRTVDNKEIPQLYRRLHSLYSDKRWIIEYRLIANIELATITARYRIPYQPNHNNECWLLTTQLNTGMDINRISNQTIENRLTVGITNTQIMAGDNERLSALIHHSGVSGIVYLRLGSESASETLYTARLKPGESIELKSVESIQAIGTIADIPVNTVGVK